MDTGTGDQNTLANSRTKPPRRTGQGLRLTQNDAGLLITGAVNEWVKAGGEASVDNDFERGSVVIVLQRALFANGDAIVAAEAAV